MLTVIIRFRSFYKTKRDHCSMWSLVHWNIHGGKPWHHALAEGGADVGKETYRRPVVWNGVGGVGV